MGLGGPSFAQDAPTPATRQQQRAGSFDCLYRRHCARRGHPFPDPLVTIVYDVNPGEAAAVREKAFSNFAGARQLVAAPHLPFPGVGHIRAEGEDTFSWHPVEFRNRTGAEEQ